MSQPRLLLLEDEALVADDLEERLTKLGYQVVARAMTAAEALALARQHRPDLVLSDIRIRGPQDGIDVAQTLRHYPGIPVVFLTAHADEATLHRARTAGPYGYIVKPYTETDLRVTIEVALERHRLEQRVQNAERMLDATLRSIGDAVIATDAKGTITFMNPVAERLTGCQEADCLGRQLGSVFLTYDPATLRAVESPAVAAIQRGETVQLECDKLLIAFGGAQRLIDDSCAPIRDEQDRIVGGILVFRDVSERRQREKERETMLIQLQKALANIKTLSGLLPICAWCKKIRDDRGYWQTVESFVKTHSEAEFTHSICPECSGKQFLKE